MLEICLRDYINMETVKFFNCISHLKLFIGCYCMVTILFKVNVDGSLFMTSFLLLLFEKDYF